MTENLPLERTAGAFGKAYVEDQVGH